MVKQRAFALLGPVLMMTGCLVIVGAAVSSFGGEFYGRHAAKPIGAAVAENTLR